MTSKHDDLQVNEADVQPQDTTELPKPKSKFFPQFLQFLLFLIKAVAWGGATWLMGMKFATSQFWVVVVSVFLMSIPICICGIYSATIRQISRLRMFAKRGWLFRLFSGRPLKVLLWGCWSLVTSFFMLIQFHTYTARQWIVFFLVIPIFWLTFAIIHRFFNTELKPYLVSHTALTWARRICPFLMLVLYVIVAQAEGVPVYQTVGDAINAQKVEVADMTGSAVARHVSQYLAIYNGFTMYALGSLSHQNIIWAMITMGVGNLVVFYNACAILSCFLIPGVEFRRVFGALSEDEHPLAVSSSHIALLVAVSTFVVLFIYLPIFSFLENICQQKSPSLSESSGNIQKRVEQIGDVLFKEGTLSSLNEAKIDASRMTESSLVKLESQADLAFNKLEENVDGYLDWYYSLTGEYSRISMLLVGELEDYMAKKLEESLSQEDAFAPFQDSLNNLLLESEKARSYYQQTAQSIMSNNRINSQDSSFQVVQSVSLQDVMNLSIHQDVLNLYTRLTVGGAGGLAAAGLTTAVVTKVLSKVMGKNILKIAAKALAKVVASKTVGGAAAGAAGAAAGATAGTVVPGVGTAVGAVIGFIGGLVVGVSVDKLLIELEEAISREEFKKSILSAIDEARVEFKAKLKVQTSSNTDLGHYATY